MWDPQVVRIRQCANARFWKYENAKMVNWKCNKCEVLTIAECQNVNAENVTNAKLWKYENGKYCVNLGGDDPSYANPQRTHIENAKTENVKMWIRDYQNVIILNASI